MTLRRCPGSLAFAQPKIELVRCPHCGSDAEVWSDEADGACSKCGQAVCRTTTQSCVDWCKYARECLGDQEYKRYQNLKTRLRKETLLKAADERLPDERQRGHARLTVAFAEKILSREPAADPNVVMAAVALAAVSRLESENGDTRAPGTASQGNEQPSAVAGILRQLGYPEGFIMEVCGILHHLREPGDLDGINFRVAHDADLLAQVAAGGCHAEPVLSAGRTSPSFLTETGKALAG